MLAEKVKVSAPYVRNHASANFLVVTVEVSSEQFAIGTRLVVNDTSGVAASVVTFLP